EPARSLGARSVRVPADRPRDVPPRPVPAAVPQRDGAVGAEAAARPRAAHQLRRRAPRGDALPRAAARAAAGAEGARSRDPALVGGGAVMDWTTTLYLQLPLFVVAGGGPLLLLLEAFAHATARRWLMFLGVLISTAALFATWLAWRHVSFFGEVTLFGGMLVADHFSLFMTMVFIVASLLATLVSADFFREHAILYGELYALLQFAAAGMIILAMAGDLTAVFLGVETMSLAAYVMTGAFRRARRPSEAAMKYFLTGAFATALLLYGIALVYGTTGTTNLGEIQKATQAHTQPAFLVGEMMLIAALGF